MKIIASILMVGVLTGCSLLPRDHDSALVSGYVSLQKSIETVDCAAKETFQPAIYLADWLNKYAVFRSDPQQIATQAVLDNLKKGNEASEAACKRWVNLANINMKSIQKAWSGR